MTHLGINGQSGISAKMAIRIEKAGHWLRLQTAYELAQARRHEERIAVERHKPRPSG